MALSAVGTRLSPSSPGSQPRRSPRGSALLSASSPSLKYPLKPLNANGGGEAIAQAKLVHNLQQQVYFLELELKFLKEHGAGGRATADTEQAREQLVAAREAMLRAEFHKEKAQADKAAAISELTRVRDRFSAAHQQLTVEVVELQAALEKRNEAEAQLRIELHDATIKYEERKSFAAGFDGQARVWAEEKNELESELNRTRGREQSLLSELLDEKNAHGHLQAKAAVWDADAAASTAHRREALRDAEEANVKLREAEMRLERQDVSLQEATAQAKLLVRENEAMKTALAELEIGAQRLRADNQRLQRDDEDRKVSRVLGRFLVRKMERRMHLAQAEQRNHEERLASLRLELAEANQRCETMQAEMERQAQQIAAQGGRSSRHAEEVARLTAENRLLSDRVETLTLSATNQTAAVERLQEENASLHAKAGMVDTIRRREQQARTLIEQAQKQLLGETDLEA